MGDTENADDNLYVSGEVTYKSLRFTTAQGIARLTLDRPPANVLSIDTMREINAALESLEYQKDVKLVVLQAAGKYFSPGFDLGDHLGDRAYVMLEEFHRIFENLAKTDKPSLAVVAGPALGAGSVLASACDIVYAAASAKFGHPEVKGGVFNPVAAALLPRLVGRKKAFEMMLGAHSMTSADAERAGTAEGERAQAEVRGVDLEQRRVLEEVVAEHRGVGTRPVVEHDADGPVAALERHRNVGHGTARVGGAIAVKPLLTRRRTGSRTRSVPRSPARLDWAL